MGRGPRIVVGVAAGLILMAFAGALTTPWVALGVAALGGWVTWRLIPAAPR